MQIIILYLSLKYNGLFCTWRSNTFSRVKKRENSLQASFYVAGSETMIRTWSSDIGFRL